jgi:hypothetical protein
LTRNLGLKPAQVAAIFKITGAAVTMGAKRFELKLRSEKTYQDQARRLMLNVKT